jgi:hypothetical protein
MRGSTASHLDTNAKTIPTLDLSQVHGAPLRLKAHVVRQGGGATQPTNKSTGGHLTIWCTGANALCDNVRRCVGLHRVAVM